MTKSSRFFLLVSLAWLPGSGSPIRADCRETIVLEKAEAALSELAAMHCNRIMLSLLRKAQGVAIFPGMFKAAAGIGGRHGRGVLLIREADGSWGPPVFLSLSGASCGIQLGIERTNLVLIFRTRSSIESLKAGKITLGVDDMLAIGPLGRENVLDADVGLKTVMLSASSPSKGLYAGVSVEGNVLRIDAAATAAYDQSEKHCLQDGDPMAGEVLPPSLRLQMKLAKLSVILPCR
jgi:SH3 domain-containing YSC84-like protein 1